MELLTERGISAGEESTWAEFCCKKLKSCPPKDYFLYTPNKDIDVLINVTSEDFSKWTLYLSIEEESISDELFEFDADGNDFNDFYNGKVVDCYNLKAPDKNFIYFLNYFDYSIDKINEIVNASHVLPLIKDDVLL